MGDVPEVWKVRRPETLPCYRRMAGRYDEQRAAKIRLSSVGPIRMLNLHGGSSHDKLSICGVYVEGLMQCSWGVEEPR